MKRIKILAVLAIVFFIVQDVMDGFRGFRKGFDAAGDETEFVSSMDVEVRPTTACVSDTLYDRASGTQAPFWANRIGASYEAERTPTMLGMLFLLGLPLLALVFYGIYCFVRMLVSVLRGDVFTRLNVRRMRFFVYSVLLLDCWMEVYRWLSFRLVERLEIPGYEVVYSGLEYSWLSYILLALFTEVFAVGVKMKEEQDLTI